jgi:HK97 family phage prohead protease
MEREIKSFGFEVRATDDNHFEGYASVFRNVDSYGDVIEPGAFKKTITEHAKRVKVLWQHDPYTPIGKPVEMQEDNHGLYVKAKISQTDEGKRAIILMRDGVIDELSIGFNTVKDEWDKENNTRKIKEVKLWEFSPVTFAANDQAVITGVKSNRFSQLLANINQELRNGGQAINREKIEQAIEALKALLTDAEPGKPTPNDDKAANDIKAMIAEMRTFAGKK